MEINKILNADILDIIFEGRNKEYGAYQLRKTYNRRLIKALGVTAAILLLSYGGFVLSSALNTTDTTGELSVQDIQLADIKPKEEQKEEPPPPIKQPPPQQVEMKQFTPPKIVHDEEVKPEEAPPPMEELEDTRIGNVNQEGVKDDGIVAPPVEDAGKGVVEAPKKVEEDWDRTFTKVEIESEYPGGSPAWQRYLNKTLRYPQEAIDNEIQGTVVIQFIVDKEGNVSDVEAVSGPEELRAEAIRVIKKSGTWTPAEQNGRKVKSYKKQPIVFRLMTDN